ncbi:MAG: InlB B-repeat-containing protein [Bacteroidales bacterium]|nr:InlB B-repeat-containing protein [Bacteroidales bacterium]
MTVTATYTETVAQTTLKYEAENATGSGTTTANSSAASGGKYVKMQSGDLTFNVNVEKAGVYDITVAYSLTEDYKAQNLVVNGVQAGTLAFNKSGSANPTFASIIAAAALEAGANTIAITNSWGWVDIDYIELSTHEAVKFDVTANPVVATTSGAIALYDFLKKNFGKKTISGVMTLDMPSDNSFKGQYDVSYIHDKSGKYTALVGFDFMQSVGKGTDWATGYTKTMIDITKELWNEGGIPYYTWHWRDPTKSTTSFNTSEVSFSLKDAFTDASCTKWNTNSTLYKGIISDLDVVAKHLLDLQEAGVAVLWRPLHEASGKWFWWGAQGAEPYKQLYYLLFDKLTNEYGLHNLIWVWNSDGTDADWYPGDNYVDIAGRDFYYQAPNTYNHSSLVTEFEAVAKVVDGKKIVTLAECGAVPYPQNMEDDGAMWSWFMPWYDEGSTKYVSSNDHNKASDWNLIMNDDRVITLEDMPGWGTVVVTPTYTVTFVDYDGTVIDEQTIEEGESAVAPTEPTREGYVFVEWDTDFTNVSADITVKAIYAEKDKADYTALNKAIADAEALETDSYTATTIKALQEALTAAKAVDTDLYAEDQATVDAATKALTDAMANLAVQTFTVTFVDYDGTTIDEQTIDYGKSAVAPEEPTREGYTFSAWEGSYENVTEDVTITATYTAKDKADYTALNKAIAEAEALETTSFTAATIVALQNALTAAKAVDTDLLAEDQVTVDAATKALTDAMSALAVQTFTVTFVDYDGTTIDEQTIEYGESAVAPKEPTREGYTFSAWEGSYENVTEDVTITATYTAKDKADYTALNKAIAEAEALETTSFTAATIVALQNALTAAKAVDTDLLAEDQVTVDAATKALTDAMSALAVQTFTVTFVDYDGTTIDEQTIEYGESAVAPKEPTRDGYTFSGWVGVYENVTADATITASYTEKGKADYTALNNAIVRAESLETVSYTTETVVALSNALTAAKAIDKNLLEEDQAIVDAATKALNDAMAALTVQTFTVTFVDYDGRTISKQTIEYGENANEPDSPVREGFVFAGWDGSYENVTADATITATYTEKAKADYTALNKAIADAEAIETTGYTAATISKLQTALNSAKAIDKNLYAEDQATIDAATKALTDAINALTVQTFTVIFVDYNGKTIDKQTVSYGESAVEPAKNPTREGYEFVGWIGSFENVTADVTIQANYEAKAMADYTELDKAIASASKLKESLYSADSWKAVESALADAQSVDRNLLEESQSVVDNAALTLNNAISDLVIVDRTVLAGTISKANLLANNASEGYNRGQYPVGSKATLAEAIAKANTVYEKVSVSQAELDKANAELVAAMEQFKASIIMADKSFLVTAINNATTALKKADGNTGSGSGQYPADAVATLENELASAQEIYKNATEQSIIDTKTKILNDAIQAFLNSVNPITVDFAELSKLVAEATELLSTTSVGEDSGQYGLLECMELSRAKQTAERMIADSKTTQRDVNDQVVILQKAIDAYRASQVLAADAIDAIPVQIYTKSHIVVVENATDAIAVYDIKGRLITLLDKESASDYAEIYLAKNGVYIVKVGTIAQQIMIQ